MEINVVIVPIVMLLYLILRKLILTTDQLGRELRFDSCPKKIISLVPSITELICDLGLEGDLVGRTSYCVHPNSISHIECIGGTKKLNLHQIRALSPDIIIANKEENVKEDIDKLDTEFKIWISDVKSHCDACDMITELGNLFDKTKEANEVVTRSEEYLRQYDSRAKFSTLYLIWRKPYMTVGGDTYINDILSKLGFKNLFEHFNRYPKVSAKDIQELSPEVILLSSEPFPFVEKHIEEIKKLSPQSDIRLVNGEIFSWYGSRLSNLL